MKLGYIELDYLSAPGLKMTKNTKLGKKERSDLQLEPFHRITPKIMTIVAVNING